MSMQQQRTPAIATRIRVSGPDNEVYGEIAVAPDGKSVVFSGDASMLRRWLESVQRQPLYAGLKPAELLGEMARMMAHSYAMRVAAV